MREIRWTQTTSSPQPTMSTTSWHHEDSSVASQLISRTRPKILPARRASSTSFTNSLNGEMCVHYTFFLGGGWGVGGRYRVDVDHWVCVQLEAEQRENLAITIRSLRNTETKQASVIVIGFPSLVPPHLYLPARVCVCRGG